MVLRSLPNNRMRTLDVLERIQAMGTDLLTIRRGPPAMHASGRVVTSFLPEDLSLIDSVPGVAMAVPETQLPSLLRLGDQDLMATVVGTGEDFPRFVKVEDNLAALRTLEEEALIQEQALQALTITIHQYQAGTVAYLTVLVAQTTVLANERSSVTLAGRKYAASVQLVKALGGGWIPEKPAM
ncbi:MAG: hypothetical protein PHH91_09615 [Desulfuromonadaceae bacterium]|nr:hypothetical protein [Desulfuromonadaceae bacterium]